MTERLLDILGEYFVNNRLQERFGITFEQFINKWQHGVWEGL